MQELETGPYTFLLVDSIPVAYRDRSPEAVAFGLYKTDRRFNKAATRAQNKWLGRERFSVVPHEQIVEVYRSVSRFGAEDEQQPQDRRGGPRRAEDQELYEKAQAYEAIVRSIPPSLAKVG